MVEQDFEVIITRQYDHEEKFAGVTVLVKHKPSGGFAYPLVGARHLNIVGASRALPFQRRHAVDSGGLVMEDEFDEFREARALEFYERQLHRSARLARRGSTGSAYTIPLLSGALYYFANRCSDNWATLGTWGTAEVAVLAAVVPVGACMSYCLYVAGFKVHEYQILPRADHWYSEDFPSFEAAKEEFVGHLLQSAEHNRRINIDREKNWSRFVFFAGLATALVVVAAFLDLVRSVQ